jgi:hypothetical protein
VAVVQFVAVIVVALVVWSVIRGRWSPVTFAAILTLFGLILYLTGDPTPGGGDGDPKRLWGSGLMTFGGPATVLLLAIAAFRQRLSRRPAETDERQ